MQSIQTMTFGSFLHPKICIQDSGRSMTTNSDLAPTVPVRNVFSSNNIRSTSKQGKNNLIEDTKHMKLSENATDVPVNNANSIWHIVKTE